MEPRAHAAAPAAAAHNPEACCVCRNDNFTECPEADLQLSAAPIRPGYGREVHQTVMVPGLYKVLCSGVLCRAKFHARCIGGNGLFPQDAQPNLLQVQVPTGWLCFWCAAASMLPSFVVDRVLGTVFLRGSACVGTLQFNGFQPGEENKGVMLLCTKGLGNTRREIHHGWPSQPEATLVINRLSVTVPRPPPPAPVPGPRVSTSAPILNIASVLRPQNDVVMTLANPASQLVDHNRYFMLAVLATQAEVPMQIADVLIRRSLHPSFAFWARIVQNELTRRTGRFLGVADASLQGLKRSWRRLDVFKMEPIRSLVAVEPPAVYAPLALPWSQDFLGDAAIMTYGATGIPAAETSPIDEDIVLGPMELSFRDPNTRTNIAIPIRGGSCTHTTLFDLNTYLVMNRAIGARWACPHCGTIAFPVNLFFDSYVYGIMLCASRGQLAGSRTDAESAALFGGIPGGIAGAQGPVGIGPHKVPLNGVKLNPSIEGVTIQMDGSWTIKIEAVEEIDLDDNEDIHQGPVGVPGPEAPPPADEVVELLEAHIEEVPEPPAPPPAAGIKRVQPPRAAKTTKKSRDD